MNRRGFLSTLTLAGCTRTDHNEVAFAMWAGEDERNRFFRGPVTEALQKQYGIRLRIVPLNDTTELVNKLLNEKSAGKNTGGSVDVVWINGENFRLAKQAGVLHGPFTQKLNNLRGYSKAAQESDFGTPIEGYEAPWLRAQFVLAYDSARTPQPPVTIEALAQWVRTHPGRFTYIAPPDFTGSAFIRHILLHFGDGPAAFAQFSEAHYAKASTRAIGLLRELRPYLWRKGETYPPSLREQNRLFANQEVDFAMSYSPAFASVLIERGQVSPSTRTFVFDTGTLANYSYLAIPYNSPHIGSAITTIDYLLSREHLLEQCRALRNPFPLEEAADLPLGPATLPASVLSTHALAEPHAEYLVRFERDWQDKVLRS